MQIYPTPPSPQNEPVPVPERQSLAGQSQFRPELLPVQPVPVMTMPSYRSQTNHDEVQSVPLHSVEVEQLQLNSNPSNRQTDPERKTDHFRKKCCAHWKWCVCVGTAFILLLLAAILIPLIYSIVKYGSTTTTTTTTTPATDTTAAAITISSTTATSSTTIPNLCSSNLLRWNTTAVTLLSGVQFTWAAGLHIDTNDTLYVAVNGGHAVWRLLANKSNATLVAGVPGSSGNTSDRLNSPQDVHVGPRGNVYVIELLNHRVQRFTNNSMIGVTIAGLSGSSGSALSQLSSPRFFYFDETDTYMYIADTNNHRVIRHFTNASSGSNGTVVAGGTGGGNNITRLNGPWGITSFPPMTNDLYITNFLGHSVMRWTPGASTGTFVAGIPGINGSNDTLLSGPTGIQLDPHLNMYIADQNNHRIQLFCHNSTGGITIAGTGVQGNSATQLNNPRAVALDSAMNLYVSDSGNGRVQKFFRL